MTKKNENANVENMVPMYRLELVRERGIPYTKVHGIEATPPLWRRWRSFIAIAVER